MTEFKAFSWLIYGRTRSCTRFCLTLSKIVFSAYVKTSNFREILLFLRT